MTARQPGTSAGGGPPSGGARLLAGATGAAATGRPVLSRDPVTAVAGAPPQAFIRDMFVPAGPTERRTLDLYCAAFIERGTGADAGFDGELALLGPDAIRAQATVGASGIAVTDLWLAPAEPALRALTLLVMCVTRGTRAHDIAASIEELGRLLDYRGDPAGSAAVARRMLRRLGMLTAAAGTSVALAGTVRLPETAEADGATYYLLADPAAAPPFGEELTVHEGTLMVTGQGGRTTRWRSGAFALTWSGRPAARRAEGRTLADLRREHALVDTGARRGEPPAAQNYTSRAASVRQASRAERIARHAVGGDTAGAVAALRDAALEPGADGPLADSLAARVGSARDYWLIRDALAQAADDQGSPGPAVPPTVLSAAGERLDDRLAQVLGLEAPSLSDEYIPVVTPMVFEISDALVPFVDSRQDNGLFLYQLIPEMRDGIEAQLGVRLPGVRARGNPGLAPGQFTISVDEARADSGLALLGQEQPYRVLPLGDGPAEAGAELCGYHPVSGRPGLWQVQSALNSPHPDGADCLTLPAYLIYRIDRVFRHHLPRFLGPQEVSTRVDAWRAIDPALVSAAVPDELAVIRLTWVLQALAEDRVPVTEWRVICEAVAAAGGTAVPVRTLARAARTRLRGQLPGPRAGARVLRVPADIQDALTGPGSQPGARERAAYRFQGWLRERIDVLGPAFSLVTRDSGVRETVAARIRPRYGLVTTFTEEEAAGS